MDTLAVTDLNTIASADDYTDLELFVASGTASENVPSDRAAAPIARTVTGAREVAWHQGLEAAITSMQQASTSAADDLQPVLPFQSAFREPVGAAMQQDSTTAPQHQDSDTLSQRSQRGPYGAAGPRRRRSIRIIEQPREPPTLMLEDADLERPTGHAMSRSNSLANLFRKSKTTVPEATPASPAGSVRSLKKPRRKSVLEFFGRSSAASAESGDEAPRRRMSRSYSIIEISAEAAAKSITGIRRGIRSMSNAIFGSMSIMSAAKGTHGDDDDKELGPSALIWFTALDQFQPLVYRFHSSKFLEFYFACSIATGEHYVLKKHFKARMTAREIASVQSMVGFARWLDHEHLIKLFGNWEDEEAIFIIEEYAVGGDLLQESMSNPDRFDEVFVAKQIVDPLLNVLAYMHGQNVVHRSICPEHLMMGRNLKLKVGHYIDAAHMGMEECNTRAGMLDYMAPEMLALDLSKGRSSRTSKEEAEASALRSNPWELQGSYNEKVDIWQVGCMVHEMLCGSMPFGAEDKQLSAALTLWADITYWPDYLSPECISFVKECLIKNPKDRPSASDLSQHPWMTRTLAGEMLLSVRQNTKPTASGWRRAFNSIRDGIMYLFSEPPPDETEADQDKHAPGAQMSSDLTHAHVPVGAK